MFGGYGPTGPPKPVEDTTKQIRIKVHPIPEILGYCELQVNDTVIHTYRSVFDALEDAGYLHRAILKTYSNCVLDTIELEKPK